MDSKVFREDSFYRINVFRINIPSLRERTGDVRQLAGFFLATAGHSDIRVLAEGWRASRPRPWP